MEYLTVRETAEKWSLSDRMVQQFCIDGRIPGAQKFGKSWAIPMEAEKPQDPRVAHRQKQQAAGPLDITCLMPLMNTPFQPGKCLAVVETMAAGPQRDISLAEYHYFSGHPEEAAKGAEPYLTSTDMGARLSACLIYAYANLPLGHIQRARFALNELKAALGSQRGSPEMEAASAFVAAAGAVLLHLPLPEGLPEIQGFFPLLPLGLRSFAMYIYAHYRYIQGDYAASVGTVEGVLAMGAGQ